jgi:signal transduction histidine kinase
VNYFRFAFLYFVIFQSFAVFGQYKNSDSVLFDFTNYNMNQDLIKLEGNCDFYWQQLIDPSEIKLPNNTEKYALKIPGSWTKLLDESGNKFPSDGYGTYHFTIKVPNQTQIYGFKLYSIFTAYKFYANGTLIAEMGTVGKTKKESVPQFLTKEVPVPVFQNGDANFQLVDVVIQVSNFHHRRAGVHYPMYFGTIQSVIKYTKGQYILNLLLIGIILIIGFNHILMYLLRRSDVSNLMFGILSMVMILRNISTDERILTNWLPNLNWELLVRLDNFSGFATIALFAFYFYFIFRKDFPKVLFYVIMGIGVLITLLVFGTKAWFYGQFRIVFEVYIGLGGLIITFGVLFRAAIKNRPGGWVSFMGMLLLYSTAVNDVLYSSGVVHTAYVAPYGIAVFMLLQSFLLTRKSALALKDNEVLASELEQEKQNLESRIEERTSELSKQAEELGKYREEQERQNFVNKNLNVVSDVMHLHKDNLITLADQLLATLVKSVNGSLGAMYFLIQENDRTYLKLLANWGLSAEATIDELDINEGITGQCFSSGAAMYLESVPDKYFTISSGLGTAAPKSLALFPLINDEKVIGVLEIASFKVLEEWHKEFLIKALVSIAAQLQIVKLNADTRLIVEDYKNYKEELQRKEDEYRELQQELEALRESKTH